MNNKNIRKTEVVSIKSNNHFTKPKHRSFKS